MISDEYIKNFYKEICENLDGDYKIVLEPGRTINEEWIEYDKVKWEIEEPLQIVINELQKNTEISLEEKIFELYKYICLNYIYDANVLYFFKRDTSNPNNIKYIAVDWYGRIVGRDWIENRKKHNRRICYEFSRFYAKSINQLINESKNENLEAVIVGDKDNLHYVVGLTGKDYSVILDQDDFTNIKDLTRLKLNLTVKGIHILRDENNKFSKLIDDYNKDKLNELKEIEDAKNKYKEKDLIKYFNLAIEALNKYNLDSQGFFEYMRFIIEDSNIKIDKIWKVDLNASEKRHERCLYFDYKEKTYLLDSIDRTLTIVNINKLDKSLFIFNPEENEYSYYGG